MGLIADTLAAGGNLLDLPGSMVRDIVGGENPFDNIYSKKRGLGALISGENRLSGREMLAKYGMKHNDPNKWEWQDFAGFGAEMATDPTNYVGLGFLRKFLGGAKKVKEANKLSNALRAKGAMPREIAEKSMIKDAAGDVPPMMWKGAEGSPIPGLNPDTAGLHPELLRQIDADLPPGGMLDPDYPVGAEWPMLVRPDSRKPFAAAKEYSAEEGRRIGGNMPGMQEVFTDNFKPLLSDSGKMDLMADGGLVEHKITERVGGAFDMNSVDSDEVLRFLNRDKLQASDVPMEWGGQVGFENQGVKEAIDAAADIGIDTSDLVVPPKMNHEWNRDVARGRMSHLDPAGAGLKGGQIEDTLNLVGTQRPTNPKTIPAETPLGQSGYDALVHGTEPSTPDDLLAMMSGLKGEKFDAAATDIATQIKHNVGGEWILGEEWSPSLIDEVLAGHHGDDTMQELLDDIGHAGIDVDDMMQKYMDPMDIPRPDVTPLSKMNAYPSDRGINLYSGELPIADALQQVPTKGIKVLAAALTGKSIAARGFNTSSHRPGFVKDRLVGGVE